MLSAVDQAQSSSSQLKMYVQNARNLSGKKKEPKPKLLGPDIFGWGGGLPREGVGAKKFSMSFETQGSQTFWRDIPGVPEKFEKKMFAFNFRTLTSWKVRTRKRAEYGFGEYGFKHRTQ